MRLPGRILILIGIIVTAVSALFCLIGLATKRWTGTLGLFCDGCYKAPAALSIISLLLLIAAVVTLVLLMFGILKGILQFVPIGILLLATIFLLGTYVSHVERNRGYSFDLMVVAHFCSYVALAITACWLGQSNTEISTPGQS